MTPRKRKNAYLETLQRRREEAARQEPEETTETEAPPTRVLRERPAPLFPSKPRRRRWK